MKQANDNYGILILKIILAIVVFILAIYSVFKIVKLIREPVNSFVVENGKVSLDETHDAYIIRNEAVLNGKDSDNGIDKTISEGNKVAKGDTAFRYYTSGEKEIREEIDELTKKIEETQKDEKIVYTNDVENIKKEEKKLINETYGLNNIESIEKNKKQIDEYTNKITKIVGESSPDGSNLKKLINERNSCYSKLTEGAEEIIAPSSGTVSYRIDELEDKFKTDDFSYLSKDFFDEFDLKSGELIQSSEKSGKIITEFNCYLAIVMNSESAKKANVGDKVKIDVGPDERVSATISYIKDDGNDKIIVFKTDTLSEKLINYRKIPVTVVWWEYEGLKVPNSAISYENNLAYVYRNRTGYAEKILVKVVRKNDSYSLVDNYTTDELSELGYTADQIRNMYNIKLFDKIQIKK